MAGLLSRFTTFVPNATILSNDHNQEFNRIVQLLNGTTTNLKTVLKTSDAGDPPLELDQLSGGPILKGFQGGIEKFRVGNTGALTIFDANPTIVFDDTAGTDSKIHHDASVLRLGSASVDHLSIDVSTGIATFAQIPILPASNPTTANQATRKQYVDDKVPQDISTAGQPAFAGITIGAGGTPIKKITFGTVNINPGNIGAGVDANVTGTITGLAVGDRLVMNPPNNLALGLAFRDVTIPLVNTVSVHLLNTSGSPIDDLDRPWEYLWFDLT